MTVFGITGLQFNTSNISVAHGFVMYVPETVSQKGASMVDVKGNVGGHLLQGRNLLSREVFGYDCLCLGSDVQVSNGTNRDRDKGVDAPEAEISFSKYFGHHSPLLEGHVIGVAQNWVWYVGWVGDVPNCPADEKV